MKRGTKYVGTFKFNVHEFFFHGGWDKQKNRCGCLISAFSFYEKTPKELQEQAEQTLKFAKSLNAEMLMVIPGRYTESEKCVLKEMTRGQMLLSAILNPENDVQTER